MAREGPVRGDVLAGKYVLVRRLGAGAMGVVWVALNNLTDRQVALKLIRHNLSGSEEVNARLLREARACGRIEHRNVVQIFDVGQTPDGDPFLVMPLLSGETLAQRIEREGPIAELEACRIARAIAKGLAAAHAVGVVHRDLKPANVFLHNEAGSDEPVVKLLDFGVSKVAQYTDAASSLTGVPLGSPAYMSPEQARGLREVDHRSDLWAYGVVLFEMLVGARPFDGPTPFAVVDQLLREEIPRLDAILPEAHPRLVSIVAGCLQRDMAQRLDDATRLAKWLKPLESGSADTKTTKPWQRALDIAEPKARTSAPSHERLVGLDDEDDEDNEDHGGDHGDGEDDGETQKERGRKERQPGSSRRLFDGDEELTQLIGEQDTRVLKAAPSEPDAQPQPVATWDAQTQVLERAPVDEQSDREHATPLQQPAVEAPAAEPQSAADPQPRPVGPSAPALQPTHVTSTSPLTANRQALVAPGAYPTVSDAQAQAGKLRQRVTLLVAAVVLAGTVTIVAVAMRSGESFPAPGADSDAGSSQTATPTSATIDDPAETSSTTGTATIEATSSPRVESSGSVETSSSTGDSDSSGTASKSAAPPVPSEKRPTKSPPRRPPKRPSRTPDWRIGIPDDPG